MRRGDDDDSTPPPASPAGTPSPTKKKQATQDTPPGMRATSSRQPVRDAPDNGDEDDSNVLKWMRFESHLIRAPDATTTRAATDRPSD